MEKNEMPIVGASAAAPVQAPVAASNVAAGASAAAPVQAPVAASNVAAGASAAAPVQSPVDWDPYEPVQYDAPENPYDTTIVDYEPEVESSDVDSDDESFHTKTRHVLRRLQYGARVGRTVNVHAYMAKHKALGIHLRNLQASHTRHLEALNVPTALSYMKDIVSNKRKIPNEEISTMLANYSFNGKVPKKLGDPDKLIPTDISLQMADKSTAIPVGVCENVPVQVTQHCLILTDFVVLEMPEDDNMSIILGRPFLNTAGAVIDCNKGKVTFNVDDKEHTVYFPKRIDKDFEFHRSQTNPMVRYKIYNKTINLPFSDFCAAIRVPQWGSCEKVRGTPRELSNLYTMICNGRSFSDDGGKISSIQQPAIRYFAYFVTKKGWSITENELNAYIEREGHRAREGTEEAEEHPDSSSDAASSSYQHYGHVEPPRHSSAQGPYYHSMYDPPAWNSDPRWE
ncbi:hypothetical protein QYE76_042561 [Lolium multiflorum]|uniref:Arabidopsis retrotransposon Orf1 C-terminal domain-containing protein n=1 Tax=Lolium multiflorum TaxID=4521 RepID=A0AAD8THE3_LOLMU|nr:hypothetical protein QYE76_042561 [Lolium multiflorum]